MNISPSFPIPPMGKNFSFGHCPTHLHSPPSNAKIRHSRSSGLASNQLEIPPFRQYEWNSSGSGPRACFFSSSGDWGGKTGSLLILCLKQAVSSKHYQNHINQHLYIRNIWSQKGKGNSKPNFNLNSSQVLVSTSSFTANLIPVIVTIFASILATYFCE